MADPLPPLRDVIREHGLIADKKFGQNFLLDSNITDKIARHAAIACGHTETGLSDKHVIEIGPGPGGLTRSLLKKDVVSLTAIEFDPRAVAVIHDLNQYFEQRIDVVEADALEIDLIQHVSAPRVIVANLPYNIATPLLIGWLKQIRESSDHYDAMILMFQKEVAQRICAHVGDKAYGRLSVISNWLCDTKKLFDLPPSAFTPAPKVTSSVVQLIPRAFDKDAPSFAAVEAVTGSAFGQRRKMLRSSLKAYADEMRACEIDETLRAENLPVESYIRLAKALID
ncbi:MAG: 16S rRNA (adenine(1518)-N(6)/adenine(1519)-N(6))-dimethyltransferase RsmA [Bdellovibrionales bacterium]